MLTSYSRLPFSCQLVPKWVLKFSWVTSELSNDSRLTSQSGFLLQLGLLGAEMQAGLTGQLQCINQAWRITNTSFFPPQESHSATAACSGHQQPPAQSMCRTQDISRGMAEDVHLLALEMSTWKTRLLETVHNWVSCRAEQEGLHNLDSVLGEAQTQYFLPAWVSSCWESFKMWDIQMCSSFLCTSISARRNLAHLSLCSLCCSPSSQWESSMLSHSIERSRSCLKIQDQEKAAGLWIENKRP